MNAKEKRQILVNALKSCNKRIAQFSGDNNPQVKEMYFRNKGYQSALEDAILLLDGNASSIKCLID